MDYGERDVIRTSRVETPPSTNSFGLFGSIHDVCSELGFFYNDEEDTNNNNNNNNNNNSMAYGTWKFNAAFTRALQ